MNNLIEELARVRVKAESVIQSVIEIALVIDKCAMEDRNEGSETSTDAS